MQCAVTITEIAQIGDSVAESKQLNKVGAITVSIVVIPPAS
jgi:hypothetical protein